MIKIGSTKFSSRRELRGYLELLLEGYPHGSIMLGQDAYMVREVLREFYEEFVKEHKGVYMIRVLEEEGEKLIDVVSHDGTEYTLSILEIG